MGKPWVRPTSYKYCMVPSCTNTTITAPDKYFFYVPKDPKIRKQWCRLMNRNAKIPLSDKSTLYCCESHFNLEADAENYIRYKLVGGRMTLKSGVVPHIFRCQKRTKHSKSRSVLEKLCRKEIISTLLNETENPIEFVSCNNDSSNDSEDMSSKEIQRMDLSQVPVDIKQEFDEVPDENSLDHPEYIGIKLENEDLDSTLFTNANEEEVKIESQDIKLEMPVYEGNFVTCDTIKNEIDTSEGETHTLVFMSIHEQFRMEKNLIEAVRRRKILYDTSDASYMKTKLKLATWEQIAREVAMESGSEAKVVWEKLRHCHRDALRRQKNCVKGGSSAVSLKPWRYQKEMEFLLPHMANRKKYANVIGSGDENNEVYENCREGGRILEPAGDESGGGIHRNYTEEIDLSEDSIFSHPGSSTNDTPPPWKKMKTDNEEKSSAQTTEISVLMNDPLYHFFMSMYETTKKMPETSQLRLKDRIFRAVSGMEATLLDISPQQPHFD
ncbi:unnamed protein product [Acanthoscelides obtectus]|nr:unnamed protein product [Acanthoscelides obtectus]CAK1659187.1 hypothetical protein AOBTE_LOCUS21332 [Acanthoscelides obtectus]